jgi:hypothetical protein
MIQGFDTFCRDAGVCSMQFGFPVSMAESANGIVSPHPAQYPVSLPDQIELPAVQEFVLPLVRLDEFVSGVGRRPGTFAKNPAVYVTSFEPGCP